MRWLILDEVLSIEKLSARSLSHVPEAVYSPEFLMVEMMAQTGALLLGAESGFLGDVVFAKIEKAEFESGWKPGDRLEIEASCENLRQEGAWIDGFVRGPRGIVGNARFLLMNVGRLVPETTTPIAFHDAFMSHFKILEKIKH